eukprot:gene6909-174_t
MDAPVGVTGAMMDVVGALVGFDGWVFHRSAGAMPRQSRDNALGALRVAACRLPDSKFRVRDWLREAAKGPFTDKVRMRLDDILVARDDFARLQWDIAASPPTVTFKTETNVMD